MLGGFVTVRTPVDISALERQITSTVQRVQIDEELREDEYRLLDGLFERKPELMLRVFGFDEELATLRFLRLFPNVKKFSLSGLFKVASLENLSLLSGDLISLDIGETKAKLDLAPATRFRGLRELRVEGHIKSLDELLESVPELKALSLWRLPLDRVSLEESLPRKIESLALTLGSLKRTDWLTNLADLRYLAVRKVRGIDDFRWLASLGKLEYLWLDGLSKFEEVPDLASNAALLRIDLTGLRELRAADALEPILHAPAIEELLVTESRLPPDAFAVLKQKESLRRVGVGLGSDRRDDEANAILQMDAPEFMGQFAAHRGLIATL
ncbi:hypothetical protein [Micromonospora sp. NPDC048947]|uniref:hypothetical protein n=1 Tax=Micromonospora sp. NPDC048947 TaxID=3154826 RepID=UPI0033E9ACEE